jgi:hypothetical protein
MPAPSRQLPEHELVDPQQYPTYRVPTVGLLFAVVAGPFIWSVHLAGGVALAPLQCSKGETWPINLLTIATAAGIAASMWVAWRIHARAHAAAPAPASTAVAFIALAGFVWGAISLLATVLEGIPNIVHVSSCPR